MDALILAAGRGSRLGQGRPKCLVALDGRTLIERQLGTLLRLGVRDVTVVVGYRADDVITALPPDVRVVRNPRFASTNSLYSFLLARPARPADLLVLNSDVLADPSVLGRLAHGVGSAIAYDSTSGAEDEQMKVEVRDGVLVEMSKTLPLHRSSGENLGLLRLSPAAAKTAFEAAEAIVAAGGSRDWLASAMNTAARTHVVSALDVAGAPWIEIDFPEDYAHARDVVAPAVDGTAQQVHAA